MVIVSDEVELKKKQLPNQKDLPRILKLTSDHKFRCVDRTINKFGEENYVG